MKSEDIRPSTPEQEQIIENKETEFRILDMKGGSNENK